MREVLRRKLLYVCSTEYVTLIIMIRHCSKGFSILTILVSSWSRSLSLYTFTQDQSRYFDVSDPRLTTSDLEN